jgi:hypothetical protein
MWGCSGAGLLSGGEAGGWRPICMRKVWGGVMSASGLTGERVMETWRSRSRLSGGESGSCGGGRGCQMPCLWRFVRGVVSMGVVCGVKGTVSGGVSGGVSSSMSSLSSLRQTLPTRPLLRNQTKKRPRRSYDPAPTPLESLCEMRPLALDLRGDQKRNVWLRFSPPPPSMGLPR